MFQYRKGRSRSVRLFQPNTARGSCILLGLSSLFILCVSSPIYPSPLKSAKPRKTCKRARVEQASRHANATRMLNAAWLSERKLVQITSTKPNWARWKRRSHIAKFSMHVYLDLHDSQRQLHVISNSPALPRPFHLPLRQETSRKAMESFWAAAA